MHSLLHSRLPHVRGVAASLLLALLPTGCGPAGVVSETLSPTPVDVVQQQAPAELLAAPSLADERGGGIFVRADGRAVRVRFDGTVVPLESHPGNAVVPGVARAAYPLGPFTALVACDNGLFVADSGWLIEPPWRSALSSDGLIATALDVNGVSWLAHASGLYRLEAGALTELKVADASIEGITAIAVAPAADEGPALWFARSDKLSYAERTTRDGFVVKDAGLTAEQLKGGIVALAGLSPSPSSSGELWAITPSTLWRFINARWQAYELGRAPSQMVSAGRVLWLKAGEDVFRYDADQPGWQQVQGLSGSKTLLAADAVGTAWLSLEAQTVAITVGSVPRVVGVFQSERVYAIETPITAMLPVSAMPGSVFFKLDDGIEKEVKRTAAVVGTGALSSTLLYSMGGRESSGAPKPASLAALNDGWHSLTATALFDDGSRQRRLLHFELKSGATGPVSYAADIKPIFETRCAKCHVTGPGRDLSSYELWVSQKDLIVNAVKDQRMPADGLMDATYVQRIARWANGGALP